jgi:hypothetical protein
MDEPNVDTVLVVPPGGWDMGFERHPALEPDACGGALPAARTTFGVLDDGRAVWRPGRHDYRHAGPCDVEALALAWRGHVSWSACDAAARLCGVAARPAYGIVEALALAGMLEARGWRSSVASSYGASRAACPRRRA